MTYQETCHYLYNQMPMFERQGSTGYKEGLGNSLAFDEHLGHPHQSYATIHIAGTNGKGSCSHSIAAILQECGYKVGLYTSPHLVDFRERIRVNGTPIDEDYVVKFVEEEKEFYEPLHPSFFELTTAMAFKYFKEKHVDIAVIEVGLGGRLDCTNIITPILSVITNISLDHTQLLGNSLEQIAFEKAGIIKPGVPVVIGEATPETRAVFDAIAAEQQAPIYYAEDEKEITSATLTSEGIMHYTCVHLGDFECELTGDFQPINMNTMVVALHKLVDRGYLADCIEPKNKALVAEEMSNAFKNVTKITGLMARWQTVRENPRVICDTGHNPAAWHYLGKQLANLKCHQLHIVFGMVEDKDVYSVMALLPKNATYFFTKGSTKRAFPETSLKIFGEQFGLKGECYPTVEEAYEAAMQGATSEDVIFIGGSTYVVADYLKTRI